LISWSTLAGQNNRYNELGCIDREGPAAAAMYELIIIKHSQTKWEWQVCDNKEKVRKQGFERNRRVAKYSGERALFLLLAARALH
jgi:hypothetical protein